MQATAAMIDEPTVFAISLECPECGGGLSLPPGTLQHEILPCGDCGAELEVLSLEPPTVELAPGVEEDWGE